MINKLRKLIGIADETSLDNSLFEGQFNQAIVKKAKKKPVKKTVKKKPVKKVTKKSTKKRSSKGR